MLKIGGVATRGKLVLAPMLQVTTLPFRLLCKRNGAGLVVSEMVHCNSLSRDSRVSLRQIMSCEEERPMAVQLVGHDKGMLLSAAQRVSSDFIDLNLGCPDTKIMKQGSGAALLGNPAKIRTIIEHLVQNIDMPVTAKIRTGLNSSHINAVEVARIVEEAGASAICVHGRTAAQRYEGAADWTVIRDVKKAVTIPVIANGGVVDEFSANACLRETGADYLMIGRAAMGDPQVFKRISHYLRTGGILPKQTAEEKIGDFLAYADLAREHDCLAYPDLKIHAQLFTKGIVGGAELRRRLSVAHSVEQVEKVMKTYDTSIN